VSISVGRSDVGSYLLVYVCVGWGRNQITIHIITFACKLNKQSLLVFTDQIM